MKTKELQTENTQLRIEVADLKQQVAVLKKMVFGQKSEKAQYVMGTGDLDQLCLFDEAEQEENHKARKQEQPVVVTAHARKSKRTHEELLKDSVVKLVSLAARLDKEVVYLAELLQNELEQYENMFSVSKGSFTSYKDYEKPFVVQNRKRGAMHVPKVPVIFVGGLIENADQTEITLDITKRLRENDIKAGVLGNDKIYDFLGFTSYEHILKSSFTDVGKVLMINDFIKRMESEEYPDIIIVQLPGTLCRFNDFLVNDFGLYSFLVSQAVTPDYFICSTMYGMYDANSFKQINQQINSRFGYEINCFHLCNKMLNAAKAVEERKMFFIKIPERQVKNEAKEMREKSGTAVYDLIDSDEQNEMFEVMMNYFKS